MRSVKALAWHESICICLCFLTRTQSSSCYWGAVPEGMAQSDQTGQKPRCVRRARKMFCTRTCGKPGEDRPDRADGRRCLCVGASDLSIAQGSHHYRFSLSLFFTSSSRAFWRRALIDGWRISYLPRKWPEVGISLTSIVRVGHGQVHSLEVCQGECTPFQGLSINFYPLLIEENLLRSSIAYYGL